MLSPSMQAAGRPTEPRGRTTKPRDTPEPPAEPAGPNSSVVIDEGGFLRVTLISDVMPGSKLEGTRGLL